MADNLHINLERLSVYLFILFSVPINKHMFEFMAILEPWIGQNTFKLLYGCLKVKFITIKGINEQQFNKKYVIRKLMESNLWS